MDKSGDSPVWRSLAVAFGDGLAFGVGMKLTQNAAGKPGATALPDLAGRLARLEQRLELTERATPSGSANLDKEVLDALVAALEARLQESAGLMDRRLADLEVRLASELKGLRQQDQALASEAETRVEAIHERFNEQVLALRQKVNEDRNALQSQVISLHREFASAVADIVEEQVANQVEERLADAVSAHLAPIEEALREEIRQAAAAKHREIADLRQRITESDRNVLDVMLSVGEMFRQAAGRYGAPNVQPGASHPTPPEAPPPPAPETPPSAPEARAEAAIPPEAPGNGHFAQAQPPESADLFVDAELPGFVHPRKRSAMWSIPLVTSFVVTAGCVALLQYL